MMNGIPYLTSLLLFLISQSCSLKEQADLIIHQGTLYTVDETFSNAEAMAVKDGLIRVQFILS